MYILDEYPTITRISHDLEVSHDLLEDAIDITRLIEKGISRESHHIECLDPTHTLLSRKDRGDSEDHHLADHLSLWMICHEDIRATQIIIIPIVYERARSDHAESLSESRSSLIIADIHEKNSSSIQRKSMSCYESRFCLCPEASESFSFHRES